MDCYTNNFPGLPCFKKLTADKHVLAELLLVPFVIINFTRLTGGVCTKVRFKSKVEVFLLAALRLMFAASQAPLATVCSVVRKKTKPNKRELSHAEKNQAKPLGPG